MKLKREIIYLDNNSTTRTDDRVLQAMMPYYTEFYGNANSNHIFGQFANDAVKKARENVAKLINARSNEIIFTSGATEAINIAIKGLAECNTNRSKHIVTVSTEHTAVLDVCRYLETKGYQVDYLPVQPDGLLDLDILREKVRPDTLLVSVMMVNNETGVIQPIKQIADIAHENGAFFMSDTTQAVGKIPVDVNELGIDLLCLSAHKFFGPKGVGALFFRQRKPFRVNLTGILHGGGHERNLRSGSLNVPAIVGLGEACVLAMKEMAQNERRIRGLAPCPKPY